MGTYRGWLCLLTFVFTAASAGAVSPWVETRTFYTNAEGLPDTEVLAVAATSSADVYAGATKGLARLSGGRWVAVPALAGTRVELLAPDGTDLLVATSDGLHRVSARAATQVASVSDELRGKLRGLAGGHGIFVATDAGLFELRAGTLHPVESLHSLLGDERRLRSVAADAGGKLAVAAMAGLYERDAAGKWSRLFPQENTRSWAPRDVRAVAYDSQGRLWFASPQGAGCFDGAWRLFTGLEGLPYDDFTAIAPGPSGSVWFGTAIGAFRYDGTNWEYRQGRRWLPDDMVRGIAVTADGRAWFATSKGLGLIERKPMSLAEKANFLEDEIDRRHRRTPYGYVLTVALKRPGDTSEWIQHDSDNDGLWTSMYGAGECFAYAATKSDRAKKRAKSAFEALRFLGTVTQGGTPPARPGFIARTILPTSGPNPNETAYTRQRDEQRRAGGDRLWKVLAPRWGTSADGKWYWKADTSSDELDGHYFFYALYYDLVADAEDEKERVRQVVRSITDHLIEHDFTMVDWDDKPTRWAVFGPQFLNHNKNWWPERGLNSLSILAYLKVAWHVTGDAKYREAYTKLIRQHSYQANLMYPKVMTGPGSGNQSDDEMAFMGYYSLLKYEKDPDLRQMYAMSLYRYWKMEEVEMSPLFNFIYAASCHGEKYWSPYGDLDLSPRGAWLDDAVDTLIRYPLDRINWAHRNSHRNDIIPLPEHTQEDGPAAGVGVRRNGKVLPADERYFEYWNHDPFRLNTGGGGNALSDGAAFLLPYYMGLHHGFVKP